MAADVDLTWPTEMTAELAEQAHGLIGAVTALGGAIGWLTPPSRAETDAWLAGVLASVAAGDGALCATWLDGGLVAIGLWRREEAACFRHMAELLKIMVHPRARGRRLSRRVTEALVANAAGAGLETLHLGVRGNNHLAIQLYEEAGFAEWGRLPDVIEVGDERFDEVRMYLRLARPAHLILRGSRPAGPGSSPRRPRPGPRT
jgi:ribosomal protein S18 acetylase RimI-like enzyme